MIGLIFSAETFDVTKDPSLNSNLNDCGPNSSYYLHRECSSWWDLHVMTQLEILYETETADQALKGVDLEDHVRKRLAWKHVSSNELRDEIGTDLESKKKERRWTNVRDERRLEIAEGFVEKSTRENLTC